MKVESMTTDIEAVLDRMYVAVRAGDLAVMPAVAEEVELALAGFEARADPALMVRVQALAERNATCLVAAGRGVRAALRRIQAIAAATDGMQTYDGHGQAKRIATPPPTLRQRL